MPELDYAHLLRNASKENKIDSPEQLLERAAAYFEWATRFGLKEETLFLNKGVVLRADKSLTRVFTLEGLAGFLGTTTRVLKGYAKLGEDWQEVLERIEQVIYQQQFEHAAVNVFNTTLIVRSLGLADRNEVSGRNGGAIAVANVANEALFDEARRLGIPLEAFGLGGPAAEVERLESEGVTP